METQNYMKMFLFGIGIILGLEITPPSSQQFILGLACACVIIGGCGCLWEEMKG